MLISPLIPDNILHIINKYNIIYIHINSHIPYLYVYDLMMKYCSKLFICLLRLLETLNTFKDTDHHISIRTKPDHSTNSMDIHIIS